MGRTKILKCSTDYRFVYETISINWRIVRGSGMIRTNDDAVLYLMKEKDEMELEL